MVFVVAQVQENDLNTSVENVRSLLATDEELDALQERASDLRKQNAELRETHARALKMLEGVDIPSLLLTPYSI